MSKPADRFDSVEEINNLLNDDKVINIKVKKVLNYAVPALALILLLGIFNFHKKEDIHDFGDAGHILQIFRSPNSAEKKIKILISKNVMELENYALLIGNYKYKSAEFSDLPDIKEEVNNLKRILEERYKFKKIEVLTNGTDEEILDKLQMMTENIPQNSYVLVVYSGHGLLENEKDGFWVPVNAKSKKVSQLINNKDISVLTKKMKSGHVLLISDACYSGTLIKRGEEDEYILRQNSLEGRKCRKVMTSGGIERVPGDSKFMEEITRVLRNNQDTLLSASELYSKIKNEVLKQTEKKPQYGSLSDAGDEDGDFIFILK